MRACTVCSLFVCSLSVFFFCQWTHFESFDRRCLFSFLLRRLYFASDKISVSPISRKNNKLQFLFRRRRKLLSYINFSHRKFFVLTNASVFCLRSINFSNKFENEIIHSEQTFMCDICSNRFQFILSSLSLVLIYRRSIFGNSAYSNRKYYPEAGRKYTNRCARTNSIFIDWVDN